MRYQDIPYAVELQRNHKQAVAIAQRLSSILDDQTKETLCGFHLNLYDADRVEESVEGYKDAFLIDLLLAAIKSAARQRASDCAEKLKALGVSNIDPE